MREFGFYWVWPNSENRWVVAEWKVIDKNEHVGELIAWLFDDEWFFDHECEDIIEERLQAP